MVRTDPAELLNEGIAAARSGDRLRTQSLLRQVTELEPGNEVAWLWRAKSADTPDEAVDCLRRALAVNPHSEVARTALPDALVRAAAAAHQADRPRARQLLAEATTLDPRHEHAWLWRAGLADTPEQGAEFYRTVLAINPQNAKAQGGLARLPTPAAAGWTCPVCDHAGPEPLPLCAACGCALTLAVPEAFDVPRAIRRPAVEAAVQRLEAAARGEQTAGGAFALGLAYLNLGQADEATKTLRAAVRLPAADPAWKDQLARLTAHRDALARTGRTAAHADLKKPLVMVVDGSRTTRRLVSATLSAAGYRVTEADSGYAAADRIREDGVPAVFVLDVNLPGIDGFSLCKTFRGSAETANVPVVFLTGKDGLFNMLRGWWAGATEYLPKPFDPHQLVEVIAGLVPAPTTGG